MPHAAILLTSALITHLLLLWLSQALTESLPASPVAGVAPQPPAQARTPQTGKKRSREGAEGRMSSFDLHCYWPL